MHPPRIRERRSDDTFQEPRMLARRRWLSPYRASCVHSQALGREAWTLVRKQFLAPNDLGQLSRLDFLTLQGKSLLPSWFRIDV